ncbi:hypothetical protein F5X68DRAFT_34066 [Plectosphaerella plurivora]|uniref:Uncharacterized protein n=1 Tax=Plectosphaerella plurivora TaxID=936078 RepID=A0A9P8V701_9PEZI|nr:hypothetical protein F5X68DRAFT_34066 [Plectosphaerella plurivora]
MPQTTFLARLLGPSLIVTVLAEFYNGDIFHEHTAPLIFLNGNVLFIAGLAVVQSHNIWRGRSAMLVTLVGWGILAVGLARMINPTGGVKVDMNGGWDTYFVTGLLCLVGLLLSIKGYK